MAAQVIPGAEEWSHASSASVGALVVHGFTGNPSSMRELAQSFADAGFNVELPRLAGHGTEVTDLLDKTWADWSSDAEAALQRLTARCSKVVVAGLSMGGALTLWLASRHSNLAGIVCINPVTQPLGDDMMGAINGMIDGGTEMFPGIGSDIADPNVKESSYPETPLRALRSLMVDGVTPLSTAYPSIKVPMMLISSRNDHVVDPVQGDFLAANYGGTCERVMLEKSFHVATQDLEKDVINTRAVEFARAVTTS
jgi:carboxylesterase